MKIRLFFAWYDCWIGFYWDRKFRALYICPFFCCVIMIKMKRKKEIDEPLDTYEFLELLDKWEEKSKNKKLIVK
jgi:hypothetical protein